MKETFYERIGEAVCRERLTNGLEVCVVPKPGYAKKYAFFSTRYGGMDTRFCLDGQWLNTPAGIAHYLEHEGRQRPAGAGKKRRGTQRLHRQRHDGLLFRFHGAF